MQLAMIARDLRRQKYLLGRTRQLLKRTKPKPHVVTLFDNHTNGKNGGKVFVLDALTTLASHYYIWLNENNFTSLCVPAQAEHLTTEIFQMFDGFSWCISSPVLYSHYASTSQLIEIDANNQSALKNITFLNAGSPGMVFGSHEAISASESSAAIQPIGCVDGDHRFLGKLIVNGYLMTRYVKASTNENTGGKDSNIVIDMTTWRAGNAVKMVLVQQYKESWSENDITEAEIFEELFSNETFYWPNKTKVLKRVKSRGEMEDMLEDSTGSARSKKFHILWKKEVYHGNIRTDVYDLGNWTSKLKLTFDFTKGRLKKYAKVRYMFNEAQDDTKDNSSEKRIQNPIFLFVLPLLSVDPATGSRWATNKDRPHTYFQGYMGVSSTSGIGYALHGYS